MDETTKERLKWKFYVLAILLNLIVLLAAFALIGFFIAPGPYNLVIAMVLLLIVLVLSVYFTKKYRIAKQWLDQQE
jgi:O-antigen/teichoic acid export membrane protein